MTDCPANRREVPVPAAPTAKVDHPVNARCFVIPEQLLLRWFQLVEPIDDCRAIEVASEMADILDGI